MTKEIWRDINGYEGLYQVSNLGRIKRFNKDKRCNIYKILKAKINNLRHNSSSIGLCKNGKHKYLSIHRLVLETFVGPRSFGMECRHLDGNPKNNKLENLKWGTPKENLQDKIKHETIICGSKHWFSILTEVQIIEIKQFHTEGKSNGEIAKIYKVNRQTISNIINKKSWKHVK
jgi:hypothetical protein